MAVFKKHEKQKSQDPQSLTSSPMDAGLWQCSRKANSLKPAPPSCHICQPVKYLISRMGSGEDAPGLCTGA
ncbi:hypothetical protein EYF80_022249 [Liparis tanakae]|uniref:Uncharacterized protein n=1 Tax=Liparis tanakae TaxID=230148 RepID=A0A4Z2HNZ1_9TELE|nr:hypothetical protein EYF80_022249 [Liparis tanakae]